jgi:hypothetical protein
MCWNLRMSRSFHLATNLKGLMSAPPQMNNCITSSSYSFFLSHTFPSLAPPQSHHTIKLTPITITHSILSPPPILIPTLTAPLPTASCTFSLNLPITFPPGQYSHTTNHPGASPLPLQSVRAHPSAVVDFQTSWVKWPDAVLNSPPLKSYLERSFAQTSMAEVALG